MKKSMLVAGVLIALAGAIWGISLSWSNPDMTSRRLWIEFTGELLAITALWFSGVLLFFLGTREK